MGWVTENEEEDAEGKIERTIKQVILDKSSKRLSEKAKIIGFPLRFMMTEKLRSICFNINV